MLAGVLAVFVLYMVATIGIAWWYSRGAKSHRAFVLGGGRFGGTALALSERATGESAWLLLGLTGHAYADGLSTIWVALGCIAGILFIWIVMAGRLRDETEKTGAMTVSSLLARRFPGKFKMLAVSEDDGWQPVKEYFAAPPFRSCWLRLPADAPQTREELGFEDLRRIADEARALGCRRWSISGGEPMMHPRFFDMVRYAAARGPYVCVAARAPGRAGRSSAATGTESRVRPGTGARGSTASGRYPGWPPRPAWDPEGCAPSGPARARHSGRRAPERRSLRPGQRGRPTRHHRGSAQHHCTEFRP